MTNPIELLISLGVNNEQSKANINQYIKNLKAENLDVTLTVEGSSSNNKVFQQMEKQIDSLQKQIKELNKQLDNIGKVNSSSNSGFSNRIISDIKQIQDEIKTFLKGQGFQNFDFRLNVDTSTGEKILKGFTATIRDVNNEIQKLSFDSNFNQINTALNDNTFKNFESSLNSVNKTLEDAKNKALITTEQFKDFKKQIEVIQFNDFEPDKSGAFNKLNSDIKEFISVSSQFNRVSQEIDEVLISIGKNGLLGSERLMVFKNKINEINNSNLTLDEKIVKLRNELNLLNNEFSQSKDIKYFEDATKKAERAVQDLESSFKKTINTYKREVRQMDLSTWENEINSLSKIPKFTSITDIDKFNEKINDAKSNLKTLNATITESARGSLTLVDQFRIALERFPIWMAASTAFFGTVRTAREFMSIIVDIDTKLVNISKVMTDDMDIAEVFDRATQSAENFGQSISAALDAYTEFARQGFKGEDLGYLADSGLVAANVGELSAQKASEYMTASMVQWNIEAENSMEIIDSWNAISNNYATTVEKLAEGQTRAGATARAMGLDFNQLNAIIGTVTAATKQSGSEIGNFVKSVLPRLISQPAQDAMAMLDVDLTDDQGNIRDIIEVYTEIANKVQYISETERIAVAEGLAGKYHISRMQLLLDDLASANSMYRSMYETSVNSAGSAMQENEKFMDSLQARINLARVEVEKLAISIGEAFLTDGMIEGLKLFNSFLGTVTSFVEKFGVLPALLGTTSTALFLLSSRFRGLTVSVGTNTASLLGFNGALQATNTWSKLSAASVRGLSIAVKSLAAATGVGLIFVGIGTALEYVIGKMGEARERAEELESQQRQMTESFSNNKDEILQLTNRFSELENQLGNTPNPNTEEYKEYLDVQNQLAQLMPTLVQGEDEYGYKIIGTSNSVKAKIELLKQQLEYQKLLNEEQQKADNKEKLELANEILKDTTKQYKNQLDTIKFLWDTVGGSLESSGIDFGLDKEIENIDDARESLTKVYEQLANPKGISENYLSQLESFRDELEKEILTLTQYENTMQGALTTIKLDSIDSIGSATKNFSNLDEETKVLTENLLVSSLQFANSKDAINELNKAVSSMAIDDSSQKAFESFFSVIENQSKNSSDNVEGFKNTLNSLKDEILNNSQLDVNSQAYKNLEIAINNLINEQYNLEVSVKDLANAQGISEEAARNQLAAMGDLEEGASSATKSLDEYVSKLQVMSSVAERVTGIYSKQVSETEDLIYIYQTLNQMTDKTTEQEKEYLDAKNKLIAIYPHLFKNNDIQIEKIIEENKANETLIKAYELAKEGKLTAEQEMTLAQANGTRARIENIKSEIKAMESLNGATYDKYEELMAKYESGQELTEHEQRFLYGASQSRGNFTGYTEYAERLAELDELTNNLNTDVDGLSNTVKEYEESQSKSKSTTEKSIYVTDKYRQAIEKLNLEIEKQQALQSKLSPHSDEYRKSLEKQIKLEKQKLALQKSQAAELQKQINSGKILQTGNITSKSSSTRLNGWNGTISSGYGNRTLNGVREFHRGIDIAMPKGTRLDANVGGKVVASGSATSQGYHSSYGNIVVVQDEAGQKHLYAHLEKAIAKLGDTISAGQQIGTIGSTGRSTGSHLHYEINVNGKTIDPSKFITDAKNGIVSVVNNTQESIDQAKSNLNALNSDILATEGNIDSLELEYINSQLESFNYKLEQYQRILDYEDTKIQSLDLTSSRYGATLERNISYMEKMQKVNQQELEYLNNLIQNGNLSGKTLEEMKKRVEELTTEMLALSNSTQAVNAELVELKMNQFNEYIDDIGYSLSRSQTIASLMDEGSADWNNEMEYQINLLKENQASIENQRETLKQLLQTQNLSAEKVKEYKELLEELSLEYWNLEKSIVDTSKTLDETSERLAEENARKLWEIYKEYEEQKKEEKLKSLEDDLEYEQKRHDRIMENYQEEMDLFRKNVQERLDLIDQQEAERDYNMEIDDLESQRRKITDQLNLLSLDDSNEAKSQRKKLQEELDKIDKDIAEKRHDRDIELQKESLNSLLENKEEEISELEKKADERFEKEKETIDKQKGYWTQYYDELINDERKFAEIKEQIVSGNFDALSEEFQGYIDELEATMPELEFSLSSSMETVGTAIRENVIDNLKEAIELLNQVQVGSASGSSKYASSSNSSKSAVGTNIKNLSTADAQVLAGKFLTDKVRSQAESASQRLKIQEKGHELASLGRSNGSGISASKSFDSVLSTLTDSEKGQLSQYLLNNTINSVSTPALQDYIRKFAKSIASLDGGGMIPRGASGGIDGKGARAVFVHPNEIISNPIDTENMVKTSSILERISRFISPITNNGLNMAGAIGGGDIYVSFGDVHNATKEQAESFGRQFINSIKRGKGGIK